MRWTLLLLLVLLAVFLVQTDRRYFSGDRRADADKDSPSRRSRYSERRKP